MAPNRDELRQKTRRLRQLLREATRLERAAANPRDAYAGHRDEMAAARQSQSQVGRDIGEIPQCAEPELVEACRHDFRLFCESFLPDWFFDPWSDDHLRIIALIQTAVLEGGLFAFAMPRAFGKTRLALAAALWAALYGHQWYILLIGASMPKARDMFDAIRSMLEENRRLIKAFPAVCYPIARLQGIAQRRLLYFGQKVIIRFTNNRIVLPNIPGSPAASNIIQFAGITASIRGTSFTRADGKVARPSLVIADDPQTDESALSMRENEKRERILQRTIKNLGGGRRPLAVLMPCTIIVRGDVADRFLDRRKHPEYRGITTKMLYKFPKNMELWHQYRELLDQDLMQGGNGELARQFYSAHRKAMDAGSKVAWPSRFRDGELSALEHAMRLWFDDKAAFAAEQQNDPEDENEATSKLSLELLQTKLSGLKRGAAANNHQHVSAFVDVHGRVLYWAVCGWSAEFGGNVIDYGTFPRQPIGYFSQAASPVAMADVYRGMGEDAYLLASLNVLTAELLNRAFPREDGASLRVGKLLIDAHWGEKTELVKSFCRRHPQSGVIVMPSIGFFIGASSKPFADYRPEPGAQIGLHWRIPPARGGDRHVLIDTNWYKSFIAARLAMPRGTPGGIEFAGDDPVPYRLLFEHCLAEEPKAVKEVAKGVVVDEWKWKPGRPDNHWWDCLVGCAVGASMLGCTPPGLQPARAKPSCGWFAAQIGKKGRR